MSGTSNTSTKGNVTITINTNSGSSGGFQNVSDPMDTPLSQDQVTWSLQHMTEQAAKEVDAKGDKAFTPAQLAAQKEKPYLRAMNRGSAIDNMVRNWVAKDPALNSRLVGQSNNGVDFTDKLTGLKYDMTTPGQVASHQLQYGKDIIILDTNGSSPIMPKGQQVPVDPNPELERAVPVLGGNDDD